MVERDQMSKIAAPNNVFFVVYNNDPVNPRLAFEAPLDNKQFNKFIPGNCMVCHGSGGRYVFSKRCGGFPFCPPDTRAAVHDSFLLPFDLSAFRFYSSDPENPLSREAQDINVFWHLNKMVLLSRLQLKSPAADEAIRGWHGVPFFQRPFDDHFIPEGWKKTKDTQQLYRRVVAPTCRSCHISNARGLTFGTFEQFNLLRSTSYVELCRSHEMPNAEQSTKVFWSSDARSQFLNRMNMQFGCGFERSSPTTSATAIASAEPSRSALEVFQDYRAQSCACVTKECLDTVEESFIREFSRMAYDDPSAGDAIETLRSEAVECHLKILSSP
jgi:hypothetical protein